MRRRQTALVRNPRGTELAGRAGVASISTLVLAGCLLWSTTGAIAAESSSTTSSESTTRDGVDTSDSYEAVDPDIRYFSIPGAWFRQYDSTRKWRRNSGYGGAGWADERGVWFQLVAPVHIQARRAKFYELRCTHEDADQSGSDLIYDAYISAERLVPGSNTPDGTAGLHVSAQTSGVTNGKVQVVDRETKLTGEVDNDNFAYYLVVDYGVTDVTPAGSLDLNRLHGCQVGYIVYEP